MRWTSSPPGALALPGGAGGASSRSSTREHHGPGREGRRRGPWPSCSRPRHRLASCLGWSGCIRSRDFREIFVFSGLRNQIRIEVASLCRSRIPLLRRKPKKSFPNEVPKKCTTQTGHQGNPRRPQHTTEQLEQRRHTSEHDNCGNTRQYLP